MSKEEKIFERNPDTDQIRSRKKGDYGNERIEEPTDTNGIPYTDDQVEAYNENAMLEDMHNSIQYRVRREVLDELWAANKVNHEGHWYIRLTDVVSIIGDDNELYENESK